MSTFLPLSSDCDPQTFPLLGAGLWGSVRDLGDGTVLKCSVRKCAGLGDGRTKIQRESTVLKAIQAAFAASSLHIPVALEWGESLSPEAPLWLRTTKVPGRVRKVAELSALPHTAACSVAYSIADALIETHRLLDAARIVSSLPGVQETVMELKSSVERDKDAELCAEQLAEAASCLKDSPSRVIHGDFNISNLLFEGDAVVSVLDFAEVRSGFLEEDVAAILSELPSFKEPLLAQLAARGLHIDQRRLTYAFAVKAFLSFVISARLGEVEAGTSARKKFDEHLHDLLR